MPDRSWKSRDGFVRSQRAVVALVKLIAENNRLTHEISRNDLPVFFAARPRQGPPESESAVIQGFGRSGNYLERVRKAFLASLQTPHGRLFEAIREFGLDIDLMPGSANLFVVARNKSTSEAVIRLKNAETFSEYLNHAKEMKADHDQEFCVALLYVLGDFERWLFDEPVPASPEVDALHEHGREIISQLSAFPAFRHPNFIGIYDLTSYARCNALPEYFRLVELGWINRSKFVVPKTEWRNLPMREFTDRWFETWLVAKSLRNTQLRRQCGRPLLESMQVFARIEADELKATEPVGFEERVALLSVIQNGVGRDRRIYGNLGGELGPMAG